MIERPGDIFKRRVLGLTQAFAPRIIQMDGLHGAQSHRIAQDVVVRSPVSEAAELRVKTKKAIECLHGAGRLTT